MSVISGTVWHQTFILFEDGVSHVRLHPTSMPTAVVYDLQRGPVAADAVDAVLDPQFADDLADALHVTNVDRLPPAALMAEWAVRCVYTDGVDGWVPRDARSAGGPDVQHLVEQALQCCGADGVDRFVHGVMVFVTRGRRVQPGLWPDVRVGLAPCPDDSHAMRLALKPAPDGDDGDAAACRQRGAQLLKQARVVLWGGAAPDRVAGTL